MFTRSLLVCLLTVIAQAQRYEPISSSGDEECALYLSGPGRTSAFDYNLNLLRGGSFGYGGQHTCITYDAVNAAYIDARKRINVASPKGEWKTEDIASVGELLLDISINLARTYGLTYEEIEKGLPLIDTTKTLIREVCPPFLAQVECRPGKYRRLDGLCTNLQHPTWGATMTPFQRLIGPLYSDGINAPRVSVSGRPLPLSRVVSRTMHPDDGYHDHAGTVMVIAWGQFMDHDYTLTATPLDPGHRNDPEECCDRPQHLKHPYCNEIYIPEDDYFYRLFNVRCINFVRGFPSPRAGCRLGSRQQFNTLTGVLDGNTVYGVTEKFSRKLRTGYGGLLRMNPVFEEYGLKDLLPLKLDFPDEGCTRPNQSKFCFEAGEIRVNEQLVLTCMHTLMAREHNRVAKAFSQVNPHWDDETLFQEARRVIIAQIQHITYNEFLPILLGKEVMEKFGIVLQKDGHWDGYDHNVNPNVIDAFASAAYRFGHSLLPTAVERWSKAHKFIASKRLSDLIRRPYDLYRAGVFDEYLMGLMNQVAQAMDDSITQEVTNHLFKKVGARFGMDLVSFNMQRGREFGVPGYMEFRKFCGLPGADTFQELFGSMPNETIRKYETIFEHPSDVDLWSGGVSERPLPGSMLGPTFACIIATQFSYSRRGDRFWYELPNQPSSFTPEQLIELRKARLGRVICDNTDIIDTVQVYPMVLPDHEINPRVPCRSGILPSMDFSKWADFGDSGFSAPSNPYVNITNAIFETKKDENATVNEHIQQSHLQNNSNILPNVTANHDSKPYIKPKTNKTDKSQNHTKMNTAYYKNALRRRRSLLPTINLRISQNDSQPAEAVQSQKASDDDEGNLILTTETDILKDMRDSRLPQKFPTKTEHSDHETIYYDDEDEINTESNEPDKDKNENIVENTVALVSDVKNLELNKNYEIVDKEVDINDQDIKRNSSKESLEDSDTLSQSLPNTEGSGLEKSLFATDKIIKDTESENGNNFTDESIDETEFGLWNDEGQSKFLQWLGLRRYDSNMTDAEINNAKKHDPLKHIMHSNEENLNTISDHGSQNVKEQFEFIPLNYNYDKSQHKPQKNPKIQNVSEESEEEDEIENNGNQSSEEQSNESKDADDSSDNNDNDSNQDEAPILQEDDDENSLGDILAELPEIKLPESIFGQYGNLGEEIKKDDHSEDSVENESDDEAQTVNDQADREKQFEDYQSDEINDETDDGTDRKNEDYQYPISDSKSDGQFEKYIHSENNRLHDDIIRDPQLLTAVKGLLENTKKVEKEAVSSGDPEYKYFWTLEYGQPK